ncbi:acyl-CoA N-acyltransferase [Chytriomyces cf. hyalinus JEL632]|nr:acyl-CoA N-acyltransferase [Chytriomyces cf. hyalinus JEL632]
MAAIHGYTCRALTLHEVPLLLDHLDAVFGAVNSVTGRRGAPRGFFEHHWDCDDQRDVRGCFGAFDESSGRLVASVRVYSRAMRLHSETSIALASATEHSLETGSCSSTVRIGGIGDVATRSEHRGKGLAHALLHLADDYMRSQFPLAVLHAGPAVVPVYSKQGWQSIPLSSTTISVSASLLSHGIDPLDASNKCITPIDFQNPSHMELIKGLYNLTAPTILGSFTRHSDFYWSEYVGTCRDPRRIPCRILYTENGKRVSELHDGDNAGYLLAEIMRHDVQTAISAFEKSNHDACVVNVLVLDLFAGKLSKTTTNANLSVEATAALQLHTTLSALFAQMIESTLKPLLPQHVPVDAIKICFTFPTALLPNEALNVMANNFNPRHRDDNNKSWADQQFRKTDIDTGFMFKIYTPFNINGPKKVISTVNDLETVLGPLDAGHTQPYAMCQDVVLKEGAPVFGFFKADRF